MDEMYSLEMLEQVYHSVECHILEDHNSASTLLKTAILKNVKSDMKKPYRKHFGKHVFLFRASFLTNVFDLQIRVPE
jgi:hypothetical protein